jgi:serine phosphatase RsbU (regulator of sigma subunit)
MPARFATALYAVFDSHTDRLTLANAGHPPLLMRQPDGRVERVHAPPGAPLGLRAAGYEEISVPFPPGAVLVGFTDGLVETRQASLDSGLNQLHGRLASAATSNVEEIADVLLALNQDGPDLEDDIALVVLRRPTPTDEESASRDLP